MHKSNIKISLMILLLIISFQIYFSIHEINIKLKGKGVQKIFHYSYCNEKLKEILVNNISIQKENIIRDDEYILINTEEEYNTINIKFNFLQSAFYCYMFLGLSSVTEIDLSKINVSFEYMGRMFENCISLVSVNFINIDTKENLIWDVCLQIVIN